MCVARNVHNIEGVNSWHPKMLLLLAPVTLYKHSLDLLPQPNPEWNNWEEAESRGTSCNLDAFRNLISHKTPQG